jgi:hypothetical protein
MSTMTDPKELYQHESNGTARAMPSTAQPASPPPDQHAGRKVPPGLLEVLTLVALLAAYGVFLILGTFVHTAQPGGDFVAGMFGPRGVLVLLTTWTWTNLLILCCLASVIGELGRRVVLGARQAPQVQAALVRGFFILLTIMAGQLTILGTPQATAIPSDALRPQESELYADICLAHFVRLAAFASLVSLLVALRPSLFRVLMEHILSMFADGHEDQRATARVPQDEEARHPLPDRESER